MYEVKAYRCSHCSKLHGQKGNCKKHEVKCFYNPDTKSCASCGHHHYDWTANTCLKGHDIDGPKKLRTQCKDYTESEY